MKTISIGYFANLILAVALVCLQAPAAHAQMGNLKQAEAAFAAASLVVLGRPVKNDDYTLLAQVGNRYPKLRDEMLQNTNFVVAVKAFKQLLAEPESNKLRAEVVGIVFREVHGRNSTALEQAAYDAQIKEQKMWYAPMVGAEKDRLSKNKDERTAMINRAFRTTMGRDADAANLQYWLPRGEHYRLVIAATRQHLYSAKGAQDLVETVTRFLNTLPFKKPTEEQIKSTLARVSKDRLIYAEMVNPNYGK